MWIEPSANLFEASDVPLCWLEKLRLLETDYPHREVVGPDCGFEVRDLEKLRKNWVRLPSGTPFRLRC